MSSALAIPVVMVVSVKIFIHLCSSISCGVCIADSSYHYISMGWFSPFQKDVAVSDFEGCDCYLDVFPPFFFSFEWSYLFGLCVAIVTLPNTLRMSHNVILNIHLVVRDIVFVTAVMYCVHLVLHLTLIVVLYFIILSLYFMSIMYMNIYTVFILLPATVVGAFAYKLWSN